MDQERQGGRGSPSGRWWALTLLTLVYTSNFIDRQIIGVLNQAIKEDLGLSDQQLGLLSGISFALLYSLLGVPLARLAERRRRVTLIGLALVLWSGFTAACGLATNFLHLFLARVGVGIGEAGCSPAAQSLLSDLYPPHRRATALSFYSLGIPLGTLFGAVLGGRIAETFGWRAAFVIVGLPGVLLALVVLATLKEPPRGRYDADRGGAHPSLGSVLKALWAAPSFRHLALGATLASFVGYGLAYFLVPFLLRGDFGLTLGKAGLYYGLFTGVTIAIGVSLGGLLTDGLGRRNPATYALVPGLAFVAAGALNFFAFRQTDLPTMAAFLTAPFILQYFYLGPTFAVTHNLVEARMRASATAILFLPINLVGLGAGPPFVGWLSDTLAQRLFTAGEFAQVCKGGKAAAGASADLALACHAASFEGLRWALLITASLLCVWAGLHYLLAARTLRRDLQRAAT